MGATCRPESVNTWRTPSALSMRTRSCAPVEVGMGLPRRLRNLAEAGEARGKLPERRELLVGVQAERAIVEHLLGLDDVGIRDAAVDRANRRAGLLIVEADALGAQLRIDDEDVLALADGLVRALGLARPAVDALHGDEGRHVRRIVRRRLRRCRAENPVDLFLLGAAELLLGALADPHGLPVHEFAHADGGQLAAVAAR